MQNSIKKYQPSFKNEEVSHDFNDKVQESIVSIIDLISELDMFHNPLKTFERHITIVSPKKEEIRNAKKKELKTKVKDRLPTLLHEIRKHEERISKEQNLDLVEIHRLFYDIS